MTIPPTEPHPDDWQDLERRAKSHKRWFYGRQPKAADLQIHADELDFDPIAATEIFWVTGTGLSQEPSRSATMAALQARQDGRRRGATDQLTILDLDYRPMFWSSPEEAHLHIRAAVDLVDVAVGNLEEC